MEKRHSARDFKLENEISEETLRKIIKTAGFPLHGKTVNLGMYTLQLANL